MFVLAALIALGAVAGINPTPSAQALLDRLRPGAPATPLGPLAPLAKGGPGITAGELEELFTVGGPRSRDDGQRAPVG